MEYNLFRSIDQISLLARESRKGKLLSPAFCVWMWISNKFCPCFRLLKYNRSGSISKDEFMALFLTTYGKNLDEERVDEVFEALDEKRQGKIVS